MRALDKWSTQNGSKRQNKVRRKAQGTKKTMSGRSHSQSIHWDDGADEPSYKTTYSSRPHSTFGGQSVERRRASTGNQDEYVPLEWNSTGIDTQFDGYTERPEDFGLGGQPPDIPTMPLDLDTYGTSTSSDVLLYESGENEGTQPRRSHSSLSNYKYEDQSQFIRNLGLTNPGEDEDDEIEQVIPTFNQQDLGDGVSFGEMEMDRQQSLNPGPSSAQIVPRRHQFRPRDTIVLGGTQEMTPSNEIHHQSYTYQRQARQRGPQGLLALEGDMELNRVNNINQLTHQTFAREGIAKPSDHLKLEGDFQRKPTQDDQQRFKYTRTARAQGPQGQIQLDKSLAHAKHSSKNDLVAFTQLARPKRVQGYRDNLSLGDGKQDFGNRKRDDHVANSTGVKPERVRTSMHRDNMKVGEGKLETESSNRLEYRHINLHHVDELRAKPSWYQQPRTSMTITGEVSHG